MYSANCFQACFEQNNQCVVRTFDTVVIHCLCHCTYMYLFLAYAKNNMLPMYHSMHLHVNTIHLICILIFLSDLDKKNSR